MQRKEAYISVELPVDFAKKFMNILKFPATVELVHDLKGEWGPGFRRLAGMNIGPSKLLSIRRPDWVKYMKAMVE